MLQHPHPLESLTVENCKEIVEIVEGGPLPDTALQRLRYLRLEKLPKLKSISTSAGDIYIDGCHKLRCIFSSSMLQDQHPSGSLRVSDCEEIVEIVALQRSRDLRLDRLPKLGRISVSASDIYISGCHKLRCVFSSSMVQHLQSLESLDVYNCEEIVEIVEGGPLPDTALQRLRHLSLEKLPKLERISVSACEISIYDCHRLRCIFSSSMLQHLRPLERFTVNNCEEIVEIVEGGLLPDTALQRLSFLNLQNLPKLRSISISALGIYIYGCHKLRCIFSSSMLQHLQSLERLIVSECKEIVEIVEGGLLPDTALQRLRYLSLDELPKLERISVSACQISISGCHKLRCIFSSSMLQRLYPLESLIVEDCEEIVEIVGGGPLPDTALQRLRVLSLQSVPKLERISVSACEVSISGCHKLRCIFSSSMLQHLHPLESLSVHNCKEIVEILEGGPLPGTAILPKLKSISISGCDKLRCIFSSSMLQHLHRLESLEVEDCEEIVEIVEGGPLPDTALQRLSCLSLKKLPKLTAICSGQLVLTSMEKINIRGCPELKKLPVLCSGIQGIRGYISASRECWEGIGWEDEHSKSLYSTIYEETEEILQGEEMTLRNLQRRVDDEASEA